MIQTDDSSRLYVGNESITVPYPVPFYFKYAEDLTVVVRYPAGLEVLQVLSTDYSVTGAGDPDGGSITMHAWALPPDHQLSITRNVPVTQLTVYEEGDSFPAKSHEGALDKLTMICQQLSRGMGTGTGDADDLGASFRVTDASGGLNAVSKRSDTTLGVDTSGSAVLRTPSEMLNWLGQVGTAWANDSERANTRATYPGQLGVQTNNNAIYIARSTLPGDWQPFLVADGVVTALDGVPNAKNNPEGDIVGTIEAQTLYNKTLQTPTIIDPSGLDADDVGLGNVDNVADADKPPSDEVLLLLFGKQSTAEKGIANGYASLDASTKVPLSQLPDVMLGAAAYKGTWNASTNTPVIPPAGPSNNGWYYIVAVAGATLINGVGPWSVGDSIISNGTSWDKVTSTAVVTSVNGKMGVVVLVPSDIGLGNVNNTSDATKNSAVAVLTNKTIDGANNTLTVRLETDVTGNLPVTRLNSGTGAQPNTWWCGDNTWKTPSGTGDVDGPPLTVDSEVPLFSGTNGKLLKRATGTGIVNVSNGIYQTPLPATALAPTGAIIEYAGMNEPPGWFFCDGRSLLQASYPELFAAIGTQFGTGGRPVLTSEKHASSNDSGTTFTLSGVTVSGTNRLLLVWVSAYMGEIPTPNVTGVKFNGVAMTKHMDKPMYIQAGNVGHFVCWYLVNPAAVTGDVVVTMSESASQFTVSAQALSGVHQATPLGTPPVFVDGAAYGTELNIDVPSTATDLIIDAQYWYITTGVYAPEVGQTEFVADQSGTGSSGLRCSYKHGEATSTHMRWTRPNQIGVYMAVAIKGIGGAAFNLPDIRGYTTAGRDDTGVLSSRRLPVVFRQAETRGNTATWNYLYSIYPDIWSPSDIALGMWVEGPGLPPKTYVAGYYDSVTLVLSEVPTEITSGTYRFYSIDASVTGSTGGKALHTLSWYEMPSHSHQWYGWSAQGGPHFPGGVGWGISMNNTYGAGWDRPHQNLQPTMIMPRIIKY